MHPSRRAARWALLAGATALGACVGRESASGVDASSEDGGRADAGTSPDAALDGPPAGETGVDAAGGSGDAGADAPPSPTCASTTALDGGWSPADLAPSLVAWLDPSSIQASGGKVVAWKDRSPNHNDAAAFGAPPAVGTAQLAGLDVVVFDGATTGMQILFSPSLAWALDDYLVEEVVRYTNTPSTSDVNGYGVLWSHQEASFPWWGVALFANTSGYYVNANGPLPPASVFYGEIRTWGGGPNGGVASAKQGYDDGQFHLVGMRRRGTTTLEMRADGATSATGPLTAHDVSATGQPVFFGGATAGQYLAGAIAEIVAVRPAAGSALCDSDVASLESYLKARYGL